MRLYATIVADPPWQYRPGRALNDGGGPSAEKHYNTEHNDVIASLPVAELAADNAHLYMWVTNPVLTEQRLRGGPTACEIVRRWGFEPKTLLTWVKSENGAGMGWFFRGDTEHVIFAVRGDLPIPSERRLPS